MIGEHTIFLSISSSPELSTYLAGWSISSSSAIRVWVVRRATKAFLRVAGMVTVKLRVNCSVMFGELKK